MASTIQQEVQRWRAEAREFEPTNAYYGSSEFRKSRESKALHAEVKKWREENPLPTPNGGNNISFGGRAWRKECGDKFAHFSFESAHTHYQEVKLKPTPGRQAQPQLLTIYRCRWCDWLHLGHETKSGNNQVIYKEDV